MQVCKSMELDSATNMLDGREILSWISKHKLH